MHMVQKALIIFILFNINYNLGRKGNIFALLQRRKNKISERFDGATYKVSRRAIKNWS